MSETVESIINGALRLLKVKQAGEVCTAEEGADGLIALNDLIEEWNNSPLMQPAKTKLTQVLTPNDGEYTFGTGGDNSTRPIKIHSAYIRDSGNIDYKVRLIGNEEYSDITFKTVTSSYPCNLYYRASYPLGVVNLYPIPTVANTLHLECQAALSTYTDVSDVVNLPAGYLKAIKFNLAIQISPEYKDPSPVVFQQAQESIAWIKRMNTQDKPIMCNPARIASGASSGNYGWLFGS